MSADKLSVKSIRARGFGFSADYLVALLSTSSRIWSNHLATLSLLRSQKPTPPHAFQRVRELTDLINQAEGTKLTLERRLQKLTDQYSQANNVLKAHNLTIDTPVHSIPPEIEGIVQASSEDMIQISLGSDEGLRNGHTVEVSRGDRYLGRAKIIRVNSDISVGQLLTEYSKAPIRKGDRVQTKVR